MPSYEILWGSPHENTFFYGCRLSHQANGSIIYENQLVPSGTVIHQWVSASSYYTDKKIPTLPLLKLGRQYRLIFEADSYPKQSTYLKLSFLDINDELISEHYFNERMNTFTVPNNMSSYQLELIAAGLEKLFFNAIQIESMDYSILQNTKSWELHPTKVILPDTLIRGLNYQQPIRLIFVEPYHLQSQKALETKWMSALNGVLLDYTEDQWLTDEMYDHLMKLIHYLDKHQLNYQLVGYGPIGNFLALYYGTLIPNATVAFSNAYLEWHQYDSWLNLVEKSKQPPLDALQQTIVQAKFYGYPKTYLSEASFNFGRLIDFSTNLFFLLEDEVRHEEASKTIVI